MKRGVRRVMLALTVLAFAHPLPGQTKRVRKSAAVEPSASAKPAPAPGGAFPLEKLTVQGNDNYTAQQVIAASGLKLGQSVAMPDFDQARERLNATGAFDMVGYRYAPSSDGKGYDAVLEVVEMKQVYPVRFEDLGVSDAQIRGWLASKDPLFAPKIPATQPSLERYAKWINEFLAQQNEHQTVVGKVVSEHPPELEILFRPTTPRPSVARVRFTNTGEIPALTVQRAFYDVAVGSIYTEQQMRTLLDNSIRPLYEAKGRIRVSFPKIETAPAEDVKGLIVTIQVEQGPVYQLGKVRYQGSATSAEQLSKMAKLMEGKPVNFDEVKAAQATIERSERRAGYLQVQSEVKRDVRDADKTVNLLFQINPGPQFMFTKVSMVGLDITTEPVVRKMWGLEPGKPFNAEYPDRFLGRIKEDGLFENLKSVRSENKVDPGEHTVEVTLYFNQDLQKADPNAPSDRDGRLPRR